MSHQRYVQRCIRVCTILHVTCYAQYYVNRSSGMLYFYPPPEWKSSQVCNYIASLLLLIYIAMHNHLQAFASVGGSLIVMDYVSHVTIKGLQMMYSRTTAVEANGGIVIYSFMQLGNFV